MLTLHIEAPTYAELIAKVREAMGDQPSAATAAPQPEAAPIQVPVAADAPAETPAKRRGRPPKTAPAPEARASSTVSEPQAQVGNSASDPSATPSEANSPSAAPAESVGGLPAGGQAGASTPEAGAADVTFDDMKAKLHEVAAKRQNDKSDDDGLVRAANIIGKYGYRKIKEVQPAHFADIIKACNADLAGA